MIQTKRKTIAALAWAVLVLQIVSLRGSEPPTAPRRKPWLPDLEVETYKLANGLTVILHEDHKAPLVSVNITYNVGSKDDPPGRTGFAHLFEHLMFEGSEHSDSTFHWPIYQNMTDSQGLTSVDTTVYYETITRNALERVLWLEADRMGFLLPSVTQRKIWKVRDVVKNERRETLDDLPLGEVDEALRRALYPPGHPYRHPPIGSMDDLSAVRLADVPPFVRKYYNPSNAFLCIAGDFEPAQARRWIKKYFGPLRRGMPVPPQGPQVPTLARQQRIVLFDRVSHAYAQLNWPTVPAHHPDEAALDVLASVLGGASKWNRLFRALTYDRQLASAASAAHPTHRLSGTFEVCLSARSGQKLDEVVRLADGEIERLKREGPTADEVRRVKIERRRSQILQLESTTSKASVLNQHAAALGEPLGYRSVLAKIFAVTPEDVKRVARAYLRPERIEIDVYPGARTARAWKDEVYAAEPDQDLNVTPVARDEIFDRSVTPEVGASPRYSALRPHRRRLSNGLELIIVKRHELPHVRMKLVVKSGETSVPRGKSGLAALTVNLLEEGTQSMSALQLEAELLEIGSSLWTEGWLESTVVNLTTVTRHLDRALDLYADVVFNPSFSDREFLRLKLSRIESIVSRADDAQEIAEDVFPRLLYRPDHPYARTTWGTLDSVRSITCEEIVAFYRWTFVPANATLIVVGDVVPDKIAGALEARFGRWPAGPIPKAPDLRLRSPLAGGRTIYLIDKPGASQAVLYMGWIGKSARSTDRHSMVILKDELGGRIATNLRDNRALTYGFAETVDFRKGGGPFLLHGSVHKFDTKTALTEVFKELTDLSGNRSITEEQVTDIQEGKFPNWIDKFETHADIAAQLAFMVSRNLPDHYLTRELAGFKAVTKLHVDLLARQLLSPRSMTVLVVGERAWIEESLRALPFGRTIRLLDTEGKPVPASDASETRPPWDRSRNPLKSG